MKPLAQNTLIQNRYLIVHLIGKGGMGEVYLAVDQRLGSAVALKRTFFAGDETLGNAFEREARILARMRHPVLPKVSDHFGEGEEQFLVMEHISGDDLSRRLEASQKPFPVSWVLFWADQLLDALSYLHSHEPPIIHRDIKPQNLKLTDENHIILLDFGLSKSSTGQTNITDSGSTGSVVGYTPHYAPMEQVRGIGTSPRSDLYSLAATLYQLLTNTVPVDALTRADAMLNEMPDPIRPPHALNPDVSPSVSQVLLKAMEVSQDKRFANAREMQKALRKVFTEMQQATSAETVAFTYQDANAEAIEEPVGTSLPRSDVQAGTASSASGSRSLTSDASPFDTPPVRKDSLPKPAEAEMDFDATIAIDPSGPPAQIPQVALQSEVKTEVFAAGGNSQPAPVYPSTPSFTPPPPPPPQLTQIISGEEAGNSDARGTSDTPAFSIGQETTPFIGYADESSGPISAPEETAAFEPAGAEFGSAADSFATRTVGTSEPSGTSLPMPPPPPVQVAAKKKAKGGNGKYIAILGGIAAILFLGIAGVGGAYWYSNYYAGGQVTEPSPSPEASIEPSPSPEPSVEIPVATNTNTAEVEPTPSSGANTAETPVAPSPVPVEPAGPIGPVSQPKQTAPNPRPTSTRQPAGPTTRPTPKPKGNDRTKILQ